jgi:hypothetical protein
MKNPTQTTTTAVLLKAIDMKLRAILEEDVRKLAEAKEIKHRNAAFLQLIAA